MGKRGRERRKIAKKKLRSLQGKTRFVYKYREYERGSTGELVKPKMTKAEHRRRWIEAVELRLQMEMEIVDLITQQARDDIYQAEDQPVIDYLNRAAAGFEEATTT